MDKIIYQDSNEEFMNAVAANGEAMVNLIELESGVKSAASQLINKSLLEEYRPTDKNKVLKWTILAAVAGLLFNVIFDPLVGYFYKIVIIGKPAAEVTLAWNVASTSINAVTSTIVSVVVYMALRPALKKAGLFFEIGKKSE